MRKVIIVMLCLSLWLCLVVWLYGCNEGKGENRVESSNTEKNTSDEDNTLPVANILSPTYLTTYVEGDLIIFNGTGYDTEDGELTGDSLQWTARFKGVGTDPEDGRLAGNALRWISDGPIGTGGAFVCSLPLGVHTITLTTVDSKGATCTKSTIIMVIPKELPQTQNALVEVHGYIRESIDYEGCIKLLGELKNTGDVPATFCKIKFIFRDDVSEGPIGSSYTYVEGTNKTITAINSESNTVLDPDDVGAFMVFTDILYKEDIYYEYEIEWREDETSSPDASLIVDGPISNSVVSADGYLDYLELSGKVKNTGTQTAILGTITFILRDSSGDVIEIAPLNTIKGETIPLPDESISTDTAVVPGGTGTFTTWPIMFGVSSYDYKIKWFDYHETASSQRTRSLSSDFIDLDQNDPKFLWKQKDEETDTLREEMHWTEGTSGNCSKRLGFSRAKVSRNDK
ncbi:MAG: hypothetical protein AB1847_04580 [bacterium]